MWMAGPSDVAMNKSTLWRYKSNTNPGCWYAMITGMNLRVINKLPLWNCKSNVDCGSRIGIFMRINPCDINMRLGRGGKIVERDDW